MQKEGIVMNEEYFILFVAVCNVIEKLEDINQLLRAKSIDDVIEELKQTSQAAENYYINRRSEEHTSELQSRFDLVCRLLLEKKKIFQSLTLVSLGPRINL